MDKYEVTQARWEKMMGANPSKFIHPDQPVEQVNFFDAQKFAKKSNGQCRLPTEAEWEYAAKGGADSRYYWGNMMDESYIWYEDNSDGTTHPVGQKQPNQYGLYDMMGNVWEWPRIGTNPTTRSARRKTPKVRKPGNIKSSVAALSILPPERSEPQTASGCIRKTAFSRK